jgi:phage-related protein
LNINIIDKAQSEFNKLPIPVQKKFNFLFTNKEAGRELASSKFKKLVNTNLFEFRVKHDSNIYRGIGAIDKEDLLLTVFFKKKTQKTPKDIIKIAYQRFKRFI